MYDDIKFQLKYNLPLNLSKISYLVVKSLVLISHRDDESLVIMLPEYEFDPCTEKQTLNEFMQGTM